MKKKRKKKGCPTCRAKTPELKYFCRMPRSYASAAFGGLKRCKDIFHGGTWI